MKSISPLFCENRRATNNRCMTADKRAKITDLHLKEAAKLKALWDARQHPTQAVFGERFDLGNQANVGHYLNGRSALNLKAARAFAEVLECDIADFSPRVAQELAALAGESYTSSGDFVKVHRADVKFSNGTGSVIYHEDDKPPLVFRSDFLRRLGIAPGNAVVVDAQGISNEPKIVDGSVVLVNRGDRERLDGDFFAFRFDGELLIKRLQAIDGVGVLASAENPNFKPKTKVYSNANEGDIDIIGRAVWTGSTL